MIPGKLRLVQNPTPKLDLGRPFGIIDKVSKVFNDKDKKLSIMAIKEVSCTIGNSEFVAFLGPSGCGKTTLLRIVAGLIPKTSGSVQIDGKDVSGPRRDFGFVFQSLNLLPWRSVLDNVLFPMEILHKRDAAAVARAGELLEMVGLSGFEHNRPHELSGGMQQRVALCRALIHKPTLLLMDEPFGALDELTRMEMHDLVLSIRAATKTTVIFVTHSVSEAIYLSDQVLVFSKRPATVVENIAVKLPYPRSAEMRYTDDFVRFERRASEALGVMKCAPTH